MVPIVNISAHFSPSFVIRGELRSKSVDDEKKENTTYSFLCLNSGLRFFPFYKCRLTVTMLTMQLRPNDCRVNKIIY